MTIGKKTNTNNHLNPNIIMKQLNNLISAFSAKPLILLFLLALLPTMASAQCPDNNHPHMIDLGLPSGTKWACCNVGASKPEDYGGYYAWGETVEKDSYTWANYSHCDGTSETIHDIGINIACTQYDVAHKNWGGEWGIPSREQYRELRKNTSQEWTTMNGVNGFKITGKNGSSIFLPAAIYNSQYIGEEGEYWCSCNYGTSPDWIEFNKSDTKIQTERGVTYSQACWGRSVRPVAPADLTFYFNVLTEENVSVQYHVISATDKTCSVGGYYAVDEDTEGSVTIPEVANGFRVVSVYEWAFRNCAKITSINLPNSITEIQNCAFQDCSALENINIPKNVNVLQSSAFSGCTNLKTIYSEIEAPSIISDNVFTTETYLNATLYVPQGTRNLYKSTGGWNNFVHIVEVGSEETKICPDDNHPHMIDLGLPSGIKWSCCNVGASKPEDYGGYYAWGETEEKETYDLSTYLHCDGTLETLHDIGLEISGTDYDVAHVKMGDSWVMPTSDNCRELIKNCTIEFVGKVGVRIIGTNGNSLFIPRNALWTSSRTHDDSMYELVWAMEFYGVYYEECYLGFNVRPIVAPSPSGIAIDKKNFPDENFRNWVLAQDYGQDGVLTEEEIAKINKISVGYRNIADLTGIEYFTAIISLQTSSNPLTTIDLSHNTELRYLYLDVNQLTSLDISKNTKLIELNCNINQLTSLDLSNNTNLRLLDCGSNQLITLDVSKNTVLTKLYCGFNQLTELILPENSLLSEIRCDCNRLKGNAIDAIISNLPETGGVFHAMNIDDISEQNIVTKAQVAAAKVKGWKTYNLNHETWNWEEYEGSDPEIAPVDQGETIDIGNEIDENTNLDGNVVGDVYYCISSGDGSYDPEEGCVVVTKPTDDSVIDGKDIFGEDFKAGYTGFVFMVAPGKGTINVEAQTTGNMVLKVRVGDNAPAQMEVNGKTKVSFSYDVSEPTMVFIYGSIAAAGAKGVMKAAGTDALKIYGIEVTSETNGIEAIDNGQLTIDNSPVYNLNGQRVESSKFNVQNSKLPKGVYIQNGKKVLVK